MKLLKKIPLWIKLPISVFLNEFGKFPLPVVFSHMQKAYADAKPLPEAVRIRAHQNAINGFAVTYTINMDICFQKLLIKLRKALMMNSFRFGYSGGRGRIMPHR